MTPTSSSIWKEGEEKHIPFSEVASYEVQHYNGVTLSLKLADKSKFKLTANINFCKTESFEVFCTDLEGTLARYAREHRASRYPDEKTFYF